MNVFLILAQTVVCAIGFKMLQFFTLIGSYSFNQKKHIASQLQTARNAYSRACRSLQLRYFIFTICFICSIYTTIQAQDSLRIVQEFAIQAIDFQLDQLGNIYTINAQNEVIKYNPEGKKQFEYSENRLGDLAVLDVNNPLEILLYYPDFQILKILDRTLSELVTLDLTSLNIFQIPTLCASSDGNIWLFDNDNQQLLKINRQGKILLQSNDLRMRIQENLNPNSLIEVDNQVFLKTVEQGIFRFDGFGNYQKMYAYPFVHFFQIQDNFILFHSKDKSASLHKLDMEIGNVETISLDIPFQKAIQQDSLWFVLDTTGNLRLTPSKK